MPYTSEINANNCTALEEKAQSDLRITSCSRRNKLKIKDNKQHASCQPVNPISKDASTWHWVVNSQPDSLHPRVAMWFSELTAAKQNPSD